MILEPKLRVSLDQVTEQQPRKSRTQVVAIVKCTK